MPRHAQDNPFYHSCEKHFFRVVKTENVGDTEEREALWEFLHWQKDVGIFCSVDEWGGCPFLLSTPQTSAFLTDDDMEMASAGISASDAEDDASALSKKEVRRPCFSWLKRQ